MDLKNQWAVDTYISSYIYYSGKLYHRIPSDFFGIKALSFDDECFDVPNQIELFVTDQHVKKVTEAVKDSIASIGVSYFLDVFHNGDDVESVRHAYEAQGFTYYYTNIILGIDTYITVDAADITIHEVENANHIQFINLTFKNYQPIPITILGDKSIHAFYAEIDNKAVGWGNVINHAPDISFFADMYTLPAYRLRGVARSLLSMMHTKAREANTQKIILVPSFMATAFFQKFGYEHLVSFSVFKSPHA